MKSFNPMGGLMKQAQEFQKKIAQLQDELRTRVVEGTSGGGMIKALVNGKLELVGLTIEREVVNPDEVDMLQDLIIAAVSQATKKAREMADSERAKITGGMSIPGML